MQNFRILGKEAFPSLRSRAQSAKPFSWATPDAFTEYTSITNVFALVCGSLAIAQPQQQQ